MHDAVWTTESGCDLRLKRKWAARCRDVLYLPYAVSIIIRIKTFTIWSLILIVYNSEDKATNVYIFSGTAVKSEPQE